MLRNQGLHHWWSVTISSPCFRWVFLPHPVISSSPVASVTVSVVTTVRSLPAGQVALPAPDSQSPRPLGPLSCCQVSQTSPSQTKPAAPPLLCPPAFLHTAIHSHSHWAFHLFVSILLITSSCLFNFLSTGILFTVLHLQDLFLDTSISQWDHTP